MEPVERDIPVEEQKVEEVKKIVEEVGKEVVDLKGEE